MTTAERITAARIAALTRTVRALQAEVDALRAQAGLPPVPKTEHVADLRGARVYTGKISAPVAQLDSATDF